MSSRLALKPFVEKAFAISGAGINPRTWAVFQDMVRESMTDRMRPFATISSAEEQRQKDAARLAFIRDLLKDDEMTTERVFVSMPKNIRFDTERHVAQHLAQQERLGRVKSRKLDINKSKYIKFWSLPNAG